MKLGILKEEKVPIDRRVPLTPLQCVELKRNYPFLDIKVMSSDFRCFSDSMYLDAGIDVVDSLRDCDILMGVKEVDKCSLIAGKTYLFFSHTIKKQEYNRNLLIEMINSNIRMIDYETLVNNKGKRILGFGKYAGIVGAYNCFLTYGLKSKKYYLKPAYNCYSRFEMEKQLSNIRLGNERIVVTGSGRVGGGIIEILDTIGIKQVDKESFLNDTFSNSVYLHLDTMDYNKRIDGQVAGKSDFYLNPRHYKSCLIDYLKHADIFIAGHFYKPPSPFLLTNNDMKSNDFNVKVIADISCDINGPIASTIRPSTIENPIYGYNPDSASEDDYSKKDVVAVMAVDNLPCELPQDASEYFGQKLIEKVIPLLLDNEKSDIIMNATICQNGDLTEKFEYLRDYINGN